MNLSIDALSLSMSAIYILVSSHSGIFRHPKGGAVLWKLAGLGVGQTTVKTVLGERFSFSADALAVVLCR